MQSSPGQKTSDDRKIFLPPVKGRVFTSSGGQGIFVLGIAAILIVASLITFRLIENSLKGQLRESLRVAAASTAQSIRLLVKDKVDDARIVAATPFVRDRILSLVAATRGRTLTAEALLKNPDAVWLTQNLGGICPTCGFIGFTVLDAEGVQLASQFPALVGNRELRILSDFFDRSLKGETVLSAPFKSNIPLPDKKGEPRPDLPVMFVSTPIRDEENKVVAVLAFRLLTGERLQPILSLNRVSETGETYIFDKNGLMLSDSRFNHHLRQIGILQQDAVAPLNLELRDPGGDMTRGLKPSLPRQSQPLTHGVGAAVRGGEGTDVDGYGDYRGVPVVGAWIWLDELRFGLITEIDVSEAHEQIIILKRAFLGMFGLIGMLGYVALGQRSSRIKARDELAQSEEVRREREELLTGIYDRAIDGIATIDERGIVESWSPGAERMFGWTAAEMVGCNINRIVPPGEREQHDQYLLNYLATGIGKIIGIGREVEAVHKDGSPLPVHLAVSELYVGGQRMFLGITRDISDRKKVEVELVRAKEEAEEASKAKSEFLAMMSHELRTPMNAILGFAQLLETDPKNTLASEYRTWIKEILKGGNHLLGLINELLDLARVESGNFSLSIEPVAVNSLVEETMMLIGPLADQSRIRVVDRISGGCNAAVSADFMRIKQVLLNLLSNAIKYNKPEGSVTLEAGEIREGFFRIVVSDTGYGIPEEEREGVFAPFQRGKADRSNIEGTGIGLSICKRLVELMKGEIGFSSVLGEGSSFWFELPLTRMAVAADKTTARDAASPRDKASPEHLHTILYVEDNPANLELVTQVLSHRRDILLLSAPQAKLGLDLACAHRPDLILMDIHLPELDGFTALKLLRTDAATRAIPVVALSASAMPGDIKRGLNAGFDDYITKPVDVVHFMQSVDRHLQQKSEAGIARTP